jgi:exonuclease SbcC
VFAAAGDAEARGALQQRMQESTEQRSTLCLRLEVAAGVESPAELEQERMALQVERLKERMGTGADQAVADDALALLRAWYELAPADSAPDLDRRVQRVEQALRP